MFDEQPHSKDSFHRPVLGQLVVRGRAVCSGSPGTSGVNDSVNVTLSCARRVIGHFADAQAIELSRPLEMRFARDDAAVTGDHGA